MSKPIHIDGLVARYDGFLIDAYGVLVDGSGALAGAAEFLARLQTRGKPFIILSNDASRLPQTAASRYRGFGLPIDPEHMVTSGSLLGPYVQQQGLAGCHCIVLGPDDSRQMLEAAGALVVPPTDDRASVIVACDDDGYDFLPGIEAALSTALRRLDRGESVHLVLPNPDLTYPKSKGEVGLTSGSVALLIESALAVRYGEAAPRFVPLGKPHTPIFEAACDRLGIDRSRTVMLGDQLGTDIQGANDFGIDSVLVGTGLGKVREGAARPTWTLPNLAP